MKINIIGQILGTSGYSSHTRNLANALNKLCDVRLQTPLYPGQELQLNDAELAMMKKEDSSDRTNIMIDLPMNWIANASKKKNIGFLVWEGDKIPISWVPILKDRRINQVWVPSTHVLNAVKNTVIESTQPSYESLAIMNKIKLVPHGVDLTIFKPLIRREDEVDKKRFTFLCNKGFRNEMDRGGIQHVIGAFVNEFKRGEARLLLKVNPAYGINPGMITGIIEKYFKETGKTECPEIMINVDNMTNEQLNNLYNDCDVFVSASEAEAFNLPVLEAMACGKPAIVCGFGGQTDYVTSTNGWIISYTLHEVKHELLYEGINHGRPNISELQQTMRSAVNSRQEVKGSAAIETANNWTWDNSAAKAMEALNSL